MPELPDVEAVRRYLIASGVVESRITGATLGWPRAVVEPSAGEFTWRVTGRTVLDVGRRAKFLYLPLDTGTLVVHLRMTGNLEVVAPSTPARIRHSAVFNLSNGRELRFTDPRRLGKLWLVDDTAPLFDKLGPEPLKATFTVGLLAERLGRRRAPIKPVLLEQGVIAGIGNIYADEVLFCARVHPTRPAADLTDVEMGRLHACIVSVLKDAVEALTSVVPSGGPSTESERGRQMLGVPRQEGAPCSRCGTPVTRLVLRGRSAYFCGACQG